MPKNEIVWCYVACDNSGRRPNDVLARTRLDGSQGRALPVGCTSAPE